MNTKTDLDRRAAAWLADGPVVLSDRVLDAALGEIHLTGQRRGRTIPWRFRPMITSMRLGAVVAILAIAVAGLVALSSGGTAGPSATPSGGTSQTPAPTGHEPDPTVDGALLPPDTTDWVSYTSAQYGIGIAYPPGWAVEPATRAWTFAADAALDPRSPAMDSFMNEEGTVRVSLWAIADESLPGGPKEVIESVAGIEAWAERFCEVTGNVGCDGVPERALPMCLEYRDCHPAAMVRYESDVQAYFTGGGEADPVFVVVVWRQDLHPTTARYGASRLLLQALLSTINGGGNAAVWPSGYLPGRLPPVLVTQAPS
jgi:hypothetical protein